MQLYVGNDADQQPFCVFYIRSAFFTLTGL